jgi:4-amino-4-deoxy-L-arabinose transferase-like glycosyltransferase
VRLFDRRLAIVAVGALAIRVLAAVVMNDHGVQGDALTFHIVAQHLADGDGFRRPFEDAPTAEHPPLWPFVLALADLVGAQGYLAHRLIGALIGTVTVVGIGVLGRVLVGETVGLVAAGIAAVNPMLWGADVSLMSEPLYGLLIVGSLLAATRVRARPGPRWALVLGLVLGLAALVRGEALLLVGLLGIPLAYVVVPEWRARLTLLACIVAGFAVVIVPWTVRNLTTFEDPVAISTNSNTIWIGANCERSFYGDLVGYWAFSCYTPEKPGEDESQWATRQRSEGLEYLGDHLGRLPAVIPRRIARTLDVGYLGQSVFINTQEGRGVWSTRAGIGVTWLLLVLSPIGAWMLWKRRAPLVELLAPVALIFLVTVVFYGVTRFRFAAEPSLCVLAAVALVAGSGRLLSLRRA